MKIEAHPNSELIHVTVTGEFSLEEAKRTFLEMLEVVACHRVDKVLFDGRKITGEPKTIERFYYGEFAAFSVFDSIGLSNTKFAYLLLEPVKDPLRFGEMVAVNRGMLVRVFDNIEEAHAWLQTASDD